MYRPIKRFFDFLIALIAIIIFLPFYIILPIFIAILLGGPVLFRQKRVGRYNKIFYLYKFRSMNNKTDKDGELLPDEDRLTTFGKLLRKSSLDELPQLFSILVGNMSIVGPRPKTVEEICLIEDTIYANRQCVRPGITGLAVIKGRNELEPDKAFRVDLEYVANMNAALDLKIFILTFIVVLFKKGVTSKNHVTFIPHYIFWEETGIKNSGEIKACRNKAKILVDSDARYVNAISKDDFNRERQRIIKKYKIRGKKNGKRKHI